MIPIELQPELYAYTAPSPAEFRGKNAIEYDEEYVWG
jgi:hypothetical protein